MENVYACIADCIRWKAQFILVLSNILIKIY